ncbi:hypothetical protein [uncultured Parolsenella sp.]|uniref:VG15 protein n=1 Tax=uncultured Parolsenella sp. TaxID=2083008 RepID=UPI0025F97471|nr:hypothetical protein [uncultured Parolsenella sp.]
MLSADELDAYDMIIDGLSESGQNYVRRMLGAWAEAHPGYSVAGMREYAIDVLADACGTYGESCAGVAADFYEEQAADANVRSALVEGAADRAKAERVVRYKAGKLAAGDYEGFVSELCSYLDTSVRRTANLTTMANAKRDRRRYGKRMRRAGVHGVRFARIPRGGETCTFCAMLASRGFVYWTEETAGKFDHFHNRCKCRIVASTDADVEGYDPTEWYARWKAYEQIDADESLTEYGKVRTKQLLSSGVAESVDDARALWLEESERMASNLAAVESKPYREAVSGLFGEGLGESVWKDIHHILKVKSGMPRESVYAYDLTAGKKIASVTDSKKRLGADFTPEMLEALESVKGSRHEVAILHNHPLSGMPSVADYASLERSGASLGIIACHDGSIIKFKVNRPGFASLSKSEAESLDDSLADFYNVRASAGKRETEIFEAISMQFGVQVERLQFNQVQAT